MKKFLKLFWGGIKNILLIFSVFIFSVFVVEIKTPLNVKKTLDDYEFFLFTLSLTILIIYIWKKIDKKFFK